MIKLLVDNKEILAEEGSSLLQACLEGGIYIPNLCFVEGREYPAASCRICFVEIEGEERPVASCTVTVKEGMVVKTDTPPVRRLQRSALKLLLSVHEVDCGRCPANKKCALQQMARFLKIGLKPKGLDRFLKEDESNQDHPLLTVHPNRCVLCGKCIEACRDRHGKPFLTFAKRGIETVVSFYGEKSASRIPCEGVPACVDVCPVGAITPKERKT